MFYIHRQVESLHRVNLAQHLLYTNKIYIQEKTREKNTTWKYYMICTAPATKTLTLIHSKQITDQLTESWTCNHEENDMELAINCFLLHSPWTETVTVSPGVLLGW